MTVRTQSKELQFLAKPSWSFGLSLDLTFQEVNETSDDRNTRIKKKPRRQKTINKKIPIKKLYRFIYSLYNSKGLACTHKPATSRLVCASSSKRVA